MHDNRELLKKHALNTHMLKHLQQCSPLQFVDSRVKAELRGVGAEVAVACLLKMRTLKKRRRKKGHLPEEHWNERSRPTPKLLKWSMVVMPSDHLVGEV